jgi:hypothetical protein
MRGVTRLFAPLRVSVTDRPVAVSAFSIWLTVSDALHCLRIANAPATCGVAIEVPFQVA